MPVDLTKSLSWKKATRDEQKMLRALQGNILKGHGRPGTVNIFFSIDTTKRREMRATLRELANYHVTSAYQQLLETERFHETGQSGNPFVAVFLSAAGYTALGIPAAAIPADANFRGGMKAAQLGDPPVASWESEFQLQIDGMVLAASENGNALRLKRDALVGLLRDAGATVVKEQAGGAIFNKSNDGIEHFGYVDGRSQPLLLTEDVDRESTDAGISRWDPEFPLSTALVAEPAPADPLSFGSYFIFRKLEQNVRGFKRREQELATLLSLVGDKRELAGALVVGRFEDGTPVTMADEAQGANPPNDFNYTQDPGARCPFHGHIRKTNPRGSGGAEPHPAERGHLMVRRGITYEDVPRKVHPSDVPESASVPQFDANVAALLPVKDVGLLFMAYNRQLSAQFEFTQVIWANNINFPIAPGMQGIDPVIGQGPAGTHDWPKTWDNPAAGVAPFAFQGFVTMRGGEYFFAPSLNFLKTL